MKNEKKLRCLNCNANLVGKFCNNCGQKTDTKRLDFNHFIKHDIIHGTFHFDKGLPFTIKQIIIRPGKVATEYIEGKRIKYYNFFYLTLILIGLILTIKGFYKQNYALEPKTFQSEYENGIKIAQSNLKVIFLLFIPLLVLCSKIVYRKQKLNISEHSIIAVINVIYFLIFALISNAIYLISKYLNFNINENLSSFFVYLGIISFIRVYYLCFKQDFLSKYRALLSAIFTAFLFLTFLILAIMVLIFVSK